jgi:hypothetical protein
MKLNWKTVKVIFAFVIAAGAIFWAVNSIQPHSYSGLDLNFGVGGGAVSVTNPSEQPVPVQLIGTGSRLFRVSSSIDGVAGASTRVGTGSSRTYVFDFTLPPGTSEFTVSGGSDVKFVAATDTRLKAAVNPVTTNTLRITIVAVLGIVLGALFYVSHQYEHRWTAMLRRGDGSTQDTRPVASVVDGGQGHAHRSANDNRA